MSLRKVHHITESWFFCFKFHVLNEGRFQTSTWGLFCPLHTPIHNYLLDFLMRSSSGNVLFCQPIIPRSFCRYLYNYTFPLNNKAELYLNCSENRIKHILFRWKRSFGRNRHWLLPLAVAGQIKQIKSH